MSPSEMCRTEDVSFGDDTTSDTKVGGEDGPDGPDGLDGLDETKWVPNASGACNGGDT